MDVSDFSRHGERRIDGRDPADRDRALVTGMQKERFRWKLGPEFDLLVGAIGKDGGFAADTPRWNRVSAAISRSPFEQGNRPLFTDLQKKPLCTTRSRLGIAGQEVAREFTRAPDLF